MKLARRPYLRLATRNGVHIEPEMRQVPTAPEVPLKVSFEGLTEAEQRKALAAFPGGQRFILVRATG